MFNATGGTVASIGSCSTAVFMVKTLVREDSRYRVPSIKYDENTRVPSAILDLEIPAMACIPSRLFWAPEMRILEVLSMANVRTIGPS